MKTQRKPLAGQWRITRMEQWDADYFDMEVPACIAVSEDLSGEFQFGLVQGQLDGRSVLREGAVFLEFTWTGFDENDPVSGRGWMRVSGDEAEGHICVHLGEDSGFSAARQP